MNRVAVTAVMAVIFLLAAAVRIYGINHNSMWYDELCSVECSTGRGLAHEVLPKDEIISSPIVLTSLNNAPPWWKIWASLGREQHPPLYFILLRGWRVLFGDSETAMRSLATLAGCIGPLLLFDFSRLIIGWRGIWPALMLALAGPVIDSSIQVRNYTPMMSFLLLAMVALIRIDLFGPTIRRLSLLALGVFGAMLTHYFALGACCAIGIYSTFCLHGRTRRAVLFTLLGCALVYAACWGPFLIQQRAGFASSQHYRDDSGSGHLMRVLWRVMFIPARWFSEPKTSTWILSALQAVLYVLPFFLVKRKKQILLAVLTIDLTVGLVAGLDIARTTNQLDLLRYTIAAAPMLFFCIAAVLQTMRPWLQHSLPAIAALACVFDIPEAFHPWEGSYRNVASELDAGMHDGDSIVFIGDPRGPWYGAWLHLGMCRYLHHRPATIAILSRPADANLQEQLRQQPHTWVITALGCKTSDFLPAATVHPYNNEYWMADVDWLEWLHAAATTRAGE